MSTARGTLCLVRPIGIGGHANDGTGMTPENTDGNGVFISGHAAPENTRAFRDAHEKKNKILVSVSAETHRKGVAQELLPFVDAMVDLCVRRLGGGAVGSRGER
jgi:hypothetical protein